MRSKTFENRFKFYPKARLSTWKDIPELPIPMTLHLTLRELSIQNMIWGKLRRGSSCWKSLWWGIRTGRLNCSNKSKSISSGKEIIKNRSKHINKCSRKIVPSRARNRKISWECNLRRPLLMRGFPRTIGRQAHTKFNQELRQYITKSA